MLGLFFGLVAPGMTQDRELFPLMCLPNMPFLFAVLICALSGAVTAAALPGYDLPFLGWVGFVPYFTLLLTQPDRQVPLLSIAFFLVFSLGAHSWYPAIFGPALGWSLVFAVAGWYGLKIRLGLWLTRRMPGALRLLALPLVWSAVEFVNFIAPYVRDWWFVSPSATQWRFPPALQILSVTGFPGLTLMVLVANLSLAALLIRALRLTPRTGLEIAPRAAIAALAVIGTLLLAGAALMPRTGTPVTIAAVTDMTLQRADMPLAGDLGQIAADPALSRKVLDENIRLTETLPAGMDLIVWPENKFAYDDNKETRAALSALAKAQSAYLSANLLHHRPAGKENTNTLFAPSGEQALQRAKINLFPAEIAAGYARGPESFAHIETPFGRLSGAICWDTHRLWILRALARKGADVIALPMDNDFDADPIFPYHHAADVVFRAVENRLTIGVGSVNGISLVVSPAGKIVAESPVNTAGAIHGQSFRHSGQSLYTRLGDWFGWALVLAAALLALFGWRRGRTT